jgi:hypothetical protein
MTTLAMLALTALALIRPDRGGAEVASGLRIEGCYNTHAMGDWDTLATAMRVSPTAFEQAGSGLSFAIGPELRWNERWGLAVTYERLLPAEREDARGRTLRLPANALLVTFEAFRRVRPALRIGVGAGGGYYQLGDEIELKALTTDLEGSGFGYHVSGLGAWTLTRGTDLTFQAGYRGAKVNVDKINRTDPRVFVPGRGFRPLDVELDFSGLSARLGIRFHT